MSGRESQHINRRSFLKRGTLGTTGLLIGFYLPELRQAHAADSVPPNSAVSGGRVTLNAWIHVSPDETVTIFIDKSEMGQSVLTGLAMIAADELECDWQKVRTEFAPADKVYFNPQFGAQGTGASTATRTSWEPLRKAGAAARMMLLEAAAHKWGVEPSECRTEKGAILHAPTGRRTSYGSVAQAAGKIPVPQEIPLKDPRDFRIIGKPTRRLDAPDKVNGRAEFGIDVRRENMLYAVVARCPVFGGKVASFDASKAKAIPGVKHVAQISSGVAVVADNTWSAMEGRRALDVKWDEGPNTNLNSAAISKLFADRAEQPGVEARKEGDAALALSSAAKKIEAVYEVPNLAHATMEPMNCTAHIRSDGVDVWVPTQFQTTTEMSAAKISGLKPEQVHVHTTYLGTGFGRRAEQDFVLEALETSKAVGAPVQVTWSREDDMQHDFYRPASYCRFTAGVGADGMPVAWTNRIACPSIFSRFFGPESLKTKGLDNSSVEGAADIPYSIPNILVNYQLTEPGVPVGFWRSVGSSQNAFFTESFVDELAGAAGKDPYEFRRQLLQKSPRHLGVLELAATKAGWATPMPAGRFRGIAVAKGFDTYVAQVAEISVDRKEGSLRVHRVVCAVDCGRVVNPATVEAQMQG